MTFLPIVGRELRIRSRRAATYHRRWTAVAGALLVGMPMLLRSSAPGGSASGKTMFVTLGVLALGYCLMEGVRQSADALSSERREGTLGLLFLTDLKGYDVVLGKLSAVSLSSFYGLLAVMPVLGLSVLAGGVTGGEFWRMALLLVNTLFLSVAIGMWVSARGRDEQKVLAGAAAILVLILGGLPLLELLAGNGNLGTHGTLALASPGYGFFLLHDSVYRGAASRFWTSMVLVHGLGWVFLGLAAWAVTKYRQDEPEAVNFWAKLRPPPDHSDAFARARLIRSVSRQTARRQRQLAINPILWLAGRRRGAYPWIWTLTLLSVVVQFGFLMLQIQAQRGFPARSIYPWLSGASLLLHFVLWFSIASMAGRFFVEARRSGAFELLLCTPLRERHILRGQRDYLLRLLGGPLVILVLMHILVTMGWRYFIPNMRYSGFSFFPVLLQIAGMATGWAAVCYVSIWLSASAKRPAQAPARAFFLVSVLPWIFCSGYLFYRFIPFGLFNWFPVGHPIVLLLINLGFIRWARGHLHAGLRATLRRQWTTRI